MQNFQCCVQRCPNASHWNGCSPVTLAEFLVAGIGRDGYVQVVWRAVAEQLLQPDLTWCRVHQVDAAHNVSDALQVIVDNNGQLIRNQSIFTQHDEVTRLAFQVMDLLALQGVAKGYGSVIGNYSNGCFSRCSTAAARARVNRAKRTDGGVVQIASGASAGVGLAIIQQALQSVVVLAAALALVGDRPVPLETVSLQRRQDQFCRAFLCPRRINILNPDKPLTLVPPGFQVAGDSGNQ